MPKATVVVPAFNCASTLSQTLEALIVQTYTDFEIVIVDDGSTDDTPQIAQAYARAPNIHLVRQANRGLAGARNTGIAAAQGDYIGFCDADDLWLPEKLAQHVAHLDANPAVGLSYAGSRLMTAEGTPTAHTQSPRLRNVTAAHILKRNPVGNGSALVMRRAALRDIATRPLIETQRDWVFDETFRQSEDIECWLRLALTTDWTIEGIPGALTLYRINPGGLSANTSRQLAAWERMITKLRPLNPAFFDRHAAPARAYQLRYLARRAISDMDGNTARKLMQRALATSGRPLIEEPTKTLITWGAAQALALLGPAALRPLSGLFRPALPKT